MQHKIAIYRTYEGYSTSAETGMILDETHEHNWDSTVDELIGGLEVPTLALQEDSEDFIREWIISQPQVGDVLHQNPHDLPIKRIA